MPVDQLAAELVDINLVTILLHKAPEFRDPIGFGGAGRSLYRICTSERFGILADHFARSCRRCSATSQAVMMSHPYLLVPSLNDISA
ncbi:MAG TPA: hypothetical protein VH477_12395 [Bryobacteraceae bacterium]